MIDGSVATVPHPERKSNFYLGFLFLPKAKRHALQTVYGFCRRMDDIVDSGTLKTDEAQRMLDFWREEIERTYAGKPTHSLSQELLPLIHAYRLPRQAFLDLIGGVEMDIRKTRYETFEDLEPYLYGVAVTVGLLCAEIFGHKFTPAGQVEEYCKNMGYAFQLTNIIRDVGADLEQGRVYLPQKDIQAAGYSMDALIHREQNTAFHSLMGRQYERAKLCYRRARNVLDPRDRTSMIAAEVMAGVYEELLEQMRISGYRVLFGRTSLSPWRKAMAAVRGLAYCYGLH